MRQPKKNGDVSYRDRAALNFKGFNHTIVRLRRAITRKNGAAESDEDDRMP
jgi:hypothetical protein